jgi:hypothetical protein
MKANLKNSASRARRSIGVLAAGLVLFVIATFKIKHTFQMTLVHTTNKEERLFDLNMWDADSVWRELLLEGSDKMEKHGQSYTGIAMEVGMVSFMYCIAQS